MTESARELVLTVGQEKHSFCGTDGVTRIGFVAIISDGSPQLGDEHVVVLDVEIVSTIDEAKQWYDRMMIERPWETRQ